MLKTEDATQATEALFGHSPEQIMTKFSGALHRGGPRVTKTEHVQNTGC
jgi:hypothetical protein